MSKLYYTPPKQELFNEVKEASISIWETYDNTYGYVDEKVNPVRRLNNVSDNFMFMVAMFDMNNQKKLADIIGKEAKDAIRERMVDGGQPSNYIVF